MEPKKYITQHRDVKEESAKTKTKKRENCEKHKGNEASD